MLNSKAFLVSVAFVFALFSITLYEVVDQESSKVTSECHNGSNLCKILE